MSIVHELLFPPTVEAALQGLSTWPNLVLFDSARPDPKLGRYSFLTAAPFEREQLNHATYGCDPFERLRQRLPELTYTHRADLPPFQGGAAGLLGYELGGCWERLPKPKYDSVEIPVLSIGLYDWVLAWDHQQERAWIIAQGWPECDDSARMICARKRIEQVLEAINMPDIGRLAADTEVNVSNASLRKLNNPPEYQLRQFDRIQSNFTRSQYLAAVGRVVEYTKAGDIFQANLSQQLRARWPQAPLDLYIRLRLCNPAPFAGYVAHDDWAILSASPERFLQVQDREVSTRPIKGTRQRRQSPEADLYTQDELQVSPKDLAENMMIVDLLRNDLSRVCEPGSIRIPQLCTVESYQTVHHLVSEIQGRMRPDCDLWDLIAATFPGGSITGCPKVRAMEIITELEQVARGAYCGSLFYLTPAGTFDSSILIRTLTYHNGWLQFPVGGGVVVQSEPEAEYEETLHKAAGMIRAL